MSESPNPTDQQPTSVVDQAVASGGSYEVLAKRLAAQGETLESLVRQLNEDRLEEFGRSQMEVIGRMRVRTENNCVGRDVTQVGDLLLFGYNVFMGLKQATRVEDVFALYRLEETEHGYEVMPVELKDSFLGIQSFVQDFQELYAYYKNTRLMQLVVRDGKLLASFQIGERITDTRVFRWSISPDGKTVKYIDNRGERDIEPPAAYDFEWQRAGREQAVQGRYAHMNILDKVFVETLGGTLTVKVENNTNDGLGIYSEPVLEANQSLDDAVFEYAAVGSMILLKILPYREEQWRYLIFNTLSRQVLRMDAIAGACIQLPDDHGIIFPGGYYLQNGEHRSFEQNMQGMRFRRSIRSPNGEDVLYIFYEPESGRMALFKYNLIERALQPPIVCHGYARLEDGRIVIFAADGDEATRVHPMQIWRTPFASEDFAARQPQKDSFLGRIGNAELVSGVSDLYSVRKEIAAPEVSLARYERLIDTTRLLFERHQWINTPPLAAMNEVLHGIVATGDAVIDEYEKVESIRQTSTRAMSDVSTQHTALLKRVRTSDWETVDDHVGALEELARLRGQLMSTRELRYVDTAAIDAMVTTVNEAQGDVSQRTAAFIATDAALQPYVDELQKLDQQAQAAATVVQLKEPLGEMTRISTALDMLSELMGGLKIDDATQRTQVVDRISVIYSRLNQVRARAEQRRSSLGSSENVAQFAAQLALFSQSIVNALGLAQTPEKCDEQLARLLVQLEEIEGQFGEHEQFLSDIVAKREELLETFESQRQSLADARQRRAQGVLDAALRIVQSLPKRTEKLASSEALHAFFAGDPLITKLKELAQRLRTELFDPVKADDIDTRVKTLRDQAFRSLQDRTDLFEGGGNVIKLGRHKFSVGNQDLELTLLPRNGELFLHLVGTEYFEAVDSPELVQLQAYWDVSTLAESPEFYRGEYLALSVVLAAHNRTDGWDDARLKQLAIDNAALTQAIREFAAPRYREGYERGIHDHDAALIIQALLPLRDAAGVLRYGPDARALAVLFWSEHERIQQPQLAVAIAQWSRRAQHAQSMQTLFASEAELQALQADVGTQLRTFAEERGLFEVFNGLSAHGDIDGLVRAAANYLQAELAQKALRFHFSSYGQSAVAALQAALKSDAQNPTQWDDMQAYWRGDDRQHRNQVAPLSERWRSALHWLQTACKALRTPEGDALLAYCGEAASWLTCASHVPSAVSNVDLRTSVHGLLGQHPRIANGRMTLQIDDLGMRAAHHFRIFVPQFERYQQLRQQVLKSYRERIRVEEFKAKPLTSFVRNKLINESYLPVIGDNLAKQIGAVGESRRTDQMGLLMMISPPGYGKTTLMEYVASRLGLIFMKINGPALGHSVRSLDPAQAPDATAAKELEKLNLALEMANNVMLYIDDIQHTHPEFLQKFISLSDGTRRIEGVWRGQTRTHDLRGKRFCVVMAGNPYTESGEVFKIPDMLANRADIYNLGDVLGGMEEVFKLSYIENSMTSNAVLAPMATRSLQDLYLLIDKARGKEVSSNALSYEYSSAELREIEATLVRMLKVREVVFRVNQQYIASAAQDDNYRQEPPFKLQGSYRNMNKLSEKITPVMNDAEMQQMLDDHYQGEAQMLTTGAEENLLKLRELRGALNAEQSTRWNDIRTEFLRQKAMGGAGADAGTRVASQLVDLVAATRELATAQQSSSELSLTQADKQGQLFTRLGQMQQAQAKQSASEWSELLGQLQSAQRASDESLQRISEALARSTQGGRGEGAAEAAERSAQLLGGLVQTAMQPVADHLEHSRRQQLGLHRVLMQVATRMQEQIDALRRSGKPTLRADEIDNAFNTMARSEVDSREK
ncbi:AAA family ATPase [Diaphorobacter sp. HDW4A]|uniref:DNA repair ATPase n=1 Tax=Diaphorobacter sp. HDW4A TaxID=2714924 RepID=UPI001407800D|nr:DNA repair ATPase [Diaphorobacter sp. HDW4A]QIL82572.1 AAA family ATPase [Diaphorobacter sp. HDW4A]